VFNRLRELGYQIETHAHAGAILSTDFPEIPGELEAAISSQTIPIEEIVGSGGGESLGTQRLRRALAALAWPKTTFTIQKLVNGVTRESISHEIDHVRTHGSGVVALEIEWNNKDPFFDRDLENFKRLHAESAISVGVIVTRGASLQAELPNLVRRFAAQKNLTTINHIQQLGLNPTPRQQADIARRVAGGASFSDAWAQSFTQDKYGAATTHWDKLEARVRRGVGNPCPLLLIGIPGSVVTFGDYSGDLSAPQTEQPL
jgi:hypothetical protein